MKGGLLAFGLKDVTRARHRGRVPTMYFSQKIKSLINAIERFWTGVPRWLAPALAIGAIAILADPSWLFRHFGPSVDDSTIHVVSGQLTSRNTTKSPYLFKAKDGRIIPLYCQPRRLLNYCLDDFPIKDASITVGYAPYRHSIFGSDGGVVVELKSEDRAFISRVVGEKNLYDAQHPSVGRRLFTAITSLISAIPIVFGLMFIAIGIVSAFRRNAGSAEPAADG